MATYTKNPTGPKVARHAVSALACRAAGKWGCSKVALVTAHANNLTKKYTNSNAKNAIRHFLWVGGMSLVVGRDHAKNIAAAHEFGLLNFATDKVDSRRDRANNAFTLTWMKNNYGNKRVIVSGVYSYMLSFRKTAERLFNQGSFTCVNKCGKV